MVTTTIKEAKASIMKLSANAAAKPQDKKEGDSFQKIFDKQTGKAEPNQNSSALRKKSLGNTGRIREKGLEKSNVESEDIDLENENAEIIDEIAEEKASELMAQISKIFDVPQERLEEILQEQDLISTDLLTESNLNGFVMELSGVKDATVLLTDGELYGKLQQVLKAGRDLVEEASDVLSLEPNVFLERLKETREEQEPAVILEEMPVENQEEVIPVMNKPEQGHESKSDHKEEAPEGQNGNLVLQETLKAQAGQALEPMAEDGTRTQRVDTEMIMRQIMDHMKIQLKPDVSSLEMQLHPASLGNLQVQLTSKGGAVTAQFFAQNETVKAALETQMIQLQESFEEQGIKVDAIEVSVQTGQFDQNLEEQGKGRQGQETPKSRGTRRIRVDGSLTQEQLDELTQEERISAEMMQAGGGTVDFTA